MKGPYLRSRALHNVTRIIMQYSSKARKLYWSAAKVTECRRHFPWQETTSMKRLYSSRKHRQNRYILATLIIVRKESENSEWVRWCLIHGFGAPNWFKSNRFYLVFTVFQIAVTKWQILKLPSHFPSYLYV